MVPIDFEAVFRAGPSPMAVLSRDFVILAVNDAYQRVSGRDRADLVGRLVFEAFPDNPEDPQGARALRSSLRRVLASGERHVMALQRYDVAIPHRPGWLEQRYWSPVNSPVVDAEGNVVLILHRVEEVTGLVRQLDQTRADPVRRDEPDDVADDLVDGELAAMRGEVYARSRELHAANQRLSAAADVMTALLADAPIKSVLEVVATRAREIADADLSVIMLPDAEEEFLLAAAVVGNHSRSYRALRVPITGGGHENGPGWLVARVYRTGRCAVTEEAHSIVADAGNQGGPEGAAAAVVPLGQPGAVRGVLAAINERRDTGLVSAALRALEPFAAQAAIALELAERREDAARVLVLEDRERIAHDLHTSVQRQLSLTGMELTAAIRLMQRPEAVGRVRRAVNDLDSVIRQLRSMVFDIAEPATKPRGGPRRRIQELITSVSGSLSVTSRLDNLLDSELDEPSTAALLAVLGEGLSLVSRHPDAGELAVTVEVHTGPGRREVRARIEAAGAGADRTGLRELIDRVASMGGSLTLNERPGSGTELTWRIPLASRAAP